VSDAPSYTKPVGIGEVMEGGTVSEVVASNVHQFDKGDIVVGRTGWQTQRYPMVPACKRSDQRESQFRPHSASRQTRSRLRTPCDNTIVVAP
jgi:NADPH-dependent curcumin reductase CurA